MLALSYTEATLSLAEIEALPGNNRVRATNGWRSYRCPLPACRGHEKVALRINMATGGYVCHRCNAKGLLAEWRDDRSNDARARGHRALARATRARPAVTATAPAPETWPWRDQWDAAIPIADDGAVAGMAYVWGRAIVPVTAIMAGVRYSARYGTAEHRRADDGVSHRCDPGPAVLVPLWSPQGPSRTLAITGVQGRYIDGREAYGWRKVQTGGTGAFLTAGADEADPVAIVEGPFDALAMADGGPAWLGTPAIACTRASLPPWLLACVLDRTVIVAFDADDAGDRGADVAIAALHGAGAIVARVRPRGHKDWADTRLAEWRGSYRPDRWPPPHDPDAPALDDLPEPRDPPRLPAGWWPGRP
jgi:hypothetical protein